MLYKQLAKLGPDEFRRYCGVKPQTFEVLVSALRPILPKSGQRGGQPGFIVEDQLLITLEYWREYRTQFHIAQSRETSEATVCRTIRRVEDALAQAGYSHLPGQKSLVQEDGGAYEQIVIDVSETPIERPKKNKGSTTAARKSSTPSAVRLRST
jgi:Helix-turn-helix of DDE superfamily endonuclease